MKKQYLIKTKIRTLLLFCSLILSGFLHAQTGCTDPQASNYDPSATVNDGSCVYPPTNYSPNYIMNLDSTLQEVSGLAFIPGLGVASLNDGGNKNELYILDSINYNIVKTIVIKNKTNIDWEAMTSDNEYLFIGDFGNNSGSRTDLVIYKVSIQDAKTMDTVSAENIYFSYPDQIDFTPGSNQTDHDCEAMVFWNDSLYLFTKQWNNQKTNLYSLPTDSGTYSARLIDSFETGFLVTGGDVSNEKEAMICGYNSSGVVFALLLSDFTSNLLDGNKRVIQLGSALQLGQMEGIVYLEDTSGIIASENFFGIPQRLHRFESQQWTSYLYHNPVNSVLDGHKNDLKSYDSLVVHDLSGKYIKTFYNYERIDLKPGTYVYTFHLQGQKFSKTVWKD